jgi:SET domain-containing protein
MYAYAGKRLRIAHFPGKGRGVLAAEAIRPGEVIEVAPVLVLTPREKPELGRPVLGEYSFEWGTGPDDDGPYDIHALALGYGALYNHAPTPNARYEHDYQLPALRFIALRDIAEGEEITINYHGETGDDEKLWFER